MLKRAISERKMRFFGLRYGIYQNAVKDETGFIMPDLTFPHISFAKIFCQNRIKKNRKFNIKFSFKTF